MNDPAREALSRAKFVQLLELDTEDPTLAYVQPVDKEYWYKAWRSERAADDRASLHVEGEGKSSYHRRRLGLQSVSYTNLTLGLCVYAYMDGKVVKAEIDDIRSRIMIICTELKTRIQFEATENDLFELFSNEQVGLFDDKATTIRLSKLSMISGLEGIRKIFLEANFKDPVIWQLKMLERDVQRAKYPMCDLISMSGISFSHGVLATMRDNLMCGVKLVINTMSVVGFTHVDPEGTYVSFRTDEDWLFDRIRIGISHIEDKLKRNPRLIHCMRRDVREKHINTPGYIFLARYLDQRLYRAGVVDFADEGGQQVVVEMIDHGFQCIVSADELLDASEFELPLTYILPRCVKARVIDEEGAPIVGDELFKLVGGDYTTENLVQRLASSDLREVLVAAKDKIDGVDVYTIQTVDNGTLLKSGLFVQLTETASANEPN